MVNSKCGRREFLNLTAATAGIVGMSGAGGAIFKPTRHSINTPANTCEEMVEERNFSDKEIGLYKGRCIERVAFPMGGIGAGMICLDGSGALSHVSLHNRPDMTNEPCAFSAISILGEKKIARVLEGPVPSWKLSPSFTPSEMMSQKCWGLPRFQQALFKARFPFGTVVLKDEMVPFGVKITGWSPFEPGDEDNASLPVAGLEYEFTNHSDKAIDAVFSFNSKNFMAKSGQSWDGQNLRDEIQPAPGGFLLRGEGTPEEPWHEGSFSAWIDEAQVKVNHAWFRGWGDSMIMAWRDVAKGSCYNKPPFKEGPPSPGATLFLPFSVTPGASKTVVLRFAWYVAGSNLRISGGGRIFNLVSDGSDPGKQTYKPWYAGRFKKIEEVISYWNEKYSHLKANSERFSQAFYDTTIPPEIVDAVSANLTILKSPTILRQVDGRLWGWEGCANNGGSCPGSCTHVWNYAQSIAHLFPNLERSLRETEFGPSLDERGHQVFRTAIPIRAENQDHEAIPAADGQLGGVMKIYRDWRISGDTAWLRQLWPKVRISLDFCIRTWDPSRRGWLEEPQHNTYDMPFWGPNGMCTSVYLGALKAAVIMGEHLNDDVTLYSELLIKGLNKIEELFNGEYFEQKIEWKNLKARYSEHADEGLDFPSSFPEDQALIDIEGPKYQYGKGCLSDGVVGAWLAMVCGLGEVLNEQQVTQHLSSVYRYNFKTTLEGHTNTARVFACGKDGGLLLCSWPKGGELSIPFAYSQEVWTGVEYQVASHLISKGLVSEGLNIIRTCRRRYDGSVRNPFNEVEAGHWYARAMSSYSLLQAISGARYDAIEEVLYVRPPFSGDFRSFIATATGYGTVGVKNNKAFLEIKYGHIPVKKIEYFSMD